MFEPFICVMRIFLICHIDNATQLSDARQYLPALRADLRHLAFVGIV